MDTKEKRTDHSRKAPKEGVEAHSRTEADAYNISQGSARFMTWLGIVLAIPGVVLLIQQNWLPGAGFLAVGLYIAWTGFGSYNLFKR